MAVTINAKGTSVSSFSVGKNGTTISQAGVITPPTGTDLTIALDTDKNLVINAGSSGPALITASDNQDLHINPATGGGQYLVLNANRWPPADGTSGQVLRTNGSGVLSWVTATGTGTVTGVSVATANGFAGTVADSSTTPAITISTSVDGILKGDGTSIAAALAGDFPVLNQDTTGNAATATTATNVAYSGLTGSEPTWNQDTTGNAATATTLQTSRTISVTGDAAWTVSFNGAANASGALTLTTVNSNVGSYGSASQVGSFTVDGKGRLTAASNITIALATSAITSGTFADARIAASNVTQHQAALTILESQITNGALLARNAGDESITGNWTFTNAISASAVPSLDQHVANKAYVDAVAAGLSWKQAVKAATTTNITLSGAQTIDGVSVVAGDRVLVKDQTTTSQNGIYTVAAGSWVRGANMDAPAEFDGATVFVLSGTINDNTGWTQTEIVATVGTSPVLWSQFSGSNTYVWGDGISITGNTVNVGGTAGRIVISTDAIDLATVGSPGTYKSVTTDSYGRVTSGTNPTTLAGYGITDATASSHVGSGGAAHAAATTSVAGFMSSTDKTKLDGVATGATANSADATLLARANHTGTQAFSTLTGLPTTLAGYGITAGTTEAEKNATTAIATTAFVDRLRSMSTPTTSGTGTLVIGDRGSLVIATGTITIPASVFAGLDVVTIFNNTATTINITQGSGLTLRLPGTATTGNRTLAQYGMCTVAFASGTVAVISGAGIA
jgi:hypothetical protein